jgi:hypothetical protein
MRARIPLAAMADNLSIFKNVAQSREAKAKARSVPIADAWKYSVFA